MPDQQIELSVYRDLENRMRGQPDDGPLARAAHQKRKRALEADLGDKTFNVVSWGQTKDANPHEMVDLIVAIVTSPPVQAAAVAGAAYVGTVLSSTFSSLLADGVKHLVGKLVGRMTTKEIQDFSIKLPDGSTVNVQSNRQVVITITNGKHVSFSFDNPPTTP
jgi:hypothetical protein